MCRRSCRVRVRVLGLALGCLLLSPQFAKAQTATAAEPWYERIRFGGDLRVRFEGFYRDDLDTRQRGRFRLRLDVSAEPTDDIEVGVRLASGDPGDPISTNQSFEGAFVPKPLNIDRAFLRYRPPALEGLVLTGGKFGYQMRRTQMVWDDDLNWEGVAERMTWGTAPVQLTLVAVQAPIDESRGEDAFLFAQGGELTVRRASHEVALTLASYVFRRLDGVARTFGADQRPRAHTNRLRVDPAGGILGFESKFRLIDVVAQYRRVTEDDEGIPWSVLVDWVRNTEAEDSADSGMWITGSAGRSDTPGAWSGGYTFGRIERNAVVSTFMFSDIPGTNLRVHIASGSYVPREGLSLDATVLVTRALEGADEPWLTRLQLDAVVEF